MSVETDEEDDSYDELLGVVEAAQAAVEAALAGLPEERAADVLDILRDRLLQMLRNRASG